MSGSSQRDDWPGRALLDSARADSQHPPGAPRKTKIWAAIRQQTHCSERGRTWLIPALAGAVAVTATLLIFRPPASQPTPPPMVVIATTQGHPVLQGATLTAAADKSTVVRFRKEATARLAATAKATFLSEDGGDRVRLLAGKVSVEVAPGEYADGSPFAVEAGAYEVRVVGTIFEVDVAPDGTVGVAVDRGVVEVTGPDVAKVRVGAGQCWTSRRQVRPCEAPEEPSPSAGEPASPAAAHAKTELQARAQTTKRTVRPARAAPVAVVVPPAADAPLAADRAPTYDDAVALLGAKNYEGAAAAFARLSKLKGRLAGQALYELAVLQAERLGDLQAALRSFEAYHVRFPGGDLRPEADLGRLQTLVSLRLTREALTASAGFLAAYPRSRRRDEVRTLRGDTLHVLERHLDAVEEYDAVGAGKFADRAAWGAVVCLTDARRTSLARERAHTYLKTFPKGRFAAHARKALDNGSLNAGATGGHPDTVNKPKEQR